jgi:hypothetical protein
MRYALPFLDVRILCCRPPNLRRQSQALILNVNDTAEHAAAGPSTGRKSDWWEGALSRPSTALHRMSMITGRHQHQHEDTQGH